MNLITSSKIDEENTLNKIFEMKACTREDFIRFKKNYLRINNFFCPDMNHHYDDYVI